MIKLFRNIRQNLLNEGKTSKYFKYAIGEIILVVIGILIALQVNNWNTERSGRNELNAILKEIHKDLVKDKSTLKLLIEENNRFVDKLQQIREHGTDMQSDSLMLLISDLHFVTNFLPANFGYNKLNKFSETRKMKDSLLSSVTNYYASYYESINNANFEFLSGYSLNKFRDYLIDFGFPIRIDSDTATSYKLSPFSDMINDPKFIGILRNFEYNRNIQGYGFKDALVKVNQNIDLLDAYFN